MAASGAFSDLNYEILERVTSSLLGVRELEISVLEISMQTHEPVVSITAQYSLDMTSEPGPLAQSISIGMSDKLKEFLLKRGIDKIDCSVMLLMDDNTLKSYLPAYGDRVSAIAFCRSQTEGDLSSTESNQCSNALNELRGKWKKERSTLRSCGFKAGNAYAERTIRRLELGWMDYSNESMCYKQVWQRCGGGVRHLTVEKTLSLKAVLNHALDAFFPSGVSQRGILQEFELELKDFQGICVNMEKTINELYIESKLKILRVYLYTKKKTEK
ncbi:uncharacterized protein LOC128555016, partial [Mercenaria mercenaria]|uniref:uncharacterized protein LOC128555016 n=1 Tax=Mercenaria mercenaria TaxID=6596 RepID=UPI00234E9548